MRTRPGGWWRGWSTGGRTTRGPSFQNKGCDTSQLTPPLYPLTAYDVIRLAGDTAWIQTQVWIRDTCSNERRLASLVEDQYPIP
jgi:hypothetical protein